jgi:hypothetical protein
MTTLHYRVDVLMEMTPLANRWVSEQWQPSAVVPVAALAPGEAPSAGTPRAQPMRVAGSHGATTWCFPGMDIELHRSEAEGYFLNLTSDTPKVFVMWRPADEAAADAPAVRPEFVTVSYNEAGRFMDGGERVDNVPMPDAIRAWMQPFVALHYKPEPRTKVKRNDPFKDGAFVRDRPPRA